MHGTVLAVLWWTHRYAGTVVSSDLTETAGHLSHATRSCCVKRSGMVSFVGSEHEHALDDIDCSTTLCRMPRSGARPSPVLLLARPRRIAQPRKAAVLLSVRAARGLHRQRQLSWPRPASPRSPNRMLRCPHRPWPRGHTAHWVQGAIQATQLRSQQDQMQVPAMRRRVSRGRRGTQRTEACRQRCRQACCRCGCSKPPLRPSVACCSVAGHTLAYPAAPSPP